MSLWQAIARLFQRRSTLANPEPWLVEALGGKPVASGVTVNENTALTSTAVFGCVRILAETVASLPLIVYRRLDRGKERAPEHPLYRILHDRPNPEMTSFEFREALMGHLCLWGNAYAEIVRDGTGQVAELWPLRPDRMRIERRADGTLRYRYLLPTGQEAVLLPEQVLHIRGLSPDGIQGYSPIRLAREAIGLAVATEEFGARFFGEGTHPGGIVEHPGKLSETAYENLRKSLTEKYSGLGKSHRLLILEEGMSWKQVGIPPEDAQFLQTRKFQVTEIARIFRIPPHMLADLERATFSNIEHQAIEFVVHTIRPWLVRWEQRINTDLILPGEQGRYFAEFLVDGLLRGDIESRYRAYAVGRQWGWLSANDIRERENMNPIEDGDVYLVPLNMVPAGSASTPPASAASQAAATILPVAVLAEERSIRAASGRQRLARSFRRLFSDAILRIIKREEADVMAKARSMLGRRDVQQFDAWLGDFYMTDMKEFLQRQTLPMFLTYADAVQAAAAEEIGAAPSMTPELEDFVRAYVAAFASRYAGSSMGQLRHVLRTAAEAGEDVLEALQARFDEWKEKRPGKVAMAETVQHAGAVTKKVFQVNGVQRIRWVNFNPSCPYCQHLHGKVIAIESSFLPAGIDFQPEGADRPLVTSVDVGHPPAHEGCDCQIAAAP